MISYAEFTLPRVEKARNARILEPLHLTSGPGESVNGREVHIYQVMDKEVESLAPFTYTVNICPDLYWISCTCKPHRETYVVCPHIAEVLYLIWSYHRFELLPYQMRTVAQPPNLLSNLKQTATGMVEGLSGVDDQVVQEQATDILNLEIVTRGMRPGRATEIKQKLQALKQRYNDPSWRQHHMVETRQDVSE